MIPINSFDNPSISSIQGVQDRFSLKITLSVVFIMGAIFALFWFFKPKEFKKASDNICQLIAAFVLPPTDAKTDKDSNKV